ncbi:hypothetical protein HGM15179_007762, partial [Zosterops borbonicus]
FPVAMYLSMATFFEMNQSHWSGQCAVCGQKDINSPHVRMPAPLPLSLASLILPFSYWIC